MRAPAYSDQPDEVFSAEAIASPTEMYARLRRTAPLARIGDTGIHLVTSWALVEEALGREADFSANLTGVLIRGAGEEPTCFEFPETGGAAVIATADEPAHSVHRQLSQPRLTSRRISNLEPALRRWSDEALDSWIASGGGDFVPIAEEVPARAVAALLGLPDRDVQLHRTWAMMGGDMLAGDVDHETMGQLGRETAKMMQYLHEHLATAMKDPSTEPDAPLLHALAIGVARGQISEADAAGIAMVMFGAGGESTAALLASAARWLAGDPDLSDRLRTEPALLPRFIEEIARLESPFKFHYRCVRRDCTFGGYALRTGDRLMLVWASANRDAAAFEAPDELRLDRRHPNHHLGFGRGAHFCIGAPLARLEARILIGELLRRTTRIETLAEDAASYTPSIFVRRLDRLPLAVVSS